MWEFDVLLVMVLAAVMLAGLARRVGAPYPVFLALGGALLAFPGHAIVFSTSRARAKSSNPAANSQCLPTSELVSQVVKPAILLKPPELFHWTFTGLLVRAAVRAARTC
jgi:threonine/homoserine/homoserine lactone efflux protein